MIRGRKRLLVVFSLLLIAIMMISCEKKEKASVEETIQVIYNAILRGESTGVEKVGRTKEYVEELQAKQKALDIDDIREDFLEAGVKVSEADIERLYSAMDNATNKLSVDVEVVNTNGKVANLKVGTTYIRNIEIDNKAAKDAIETTEKEGLTDPDTIKTRYIDLYINNLVEAYNNIEVSKDYRYIKSQFKLVDGFWQVEDSEEFEKELIKLAIEANE
ncbi:MAG: hypothetical protein ACRDA5_14660 [Clostridium sp.]